VADPARRMSAADALRHPWLREHDAAVASSRAQVLDKSVFDGLCKYQASSKLKRAILKLLAKEADEERVKTLREQFRTLDVQQDGFLSREELLRGLRQCQGFGDMTALDLMRLLPPDLFGEKISFTDFTAALLARQGFGKAELMAAFRRFDVRKEGKISLAALSEVLKNAGPASKLEAFKEADVGQDGAIDFDEFCALINA
ncbi:CPK9, partial [Symbiodinium sp. CCMP2456]